MCTTFKKIKDNIISFETDWNHDPDGSIWEITRLQIARTIALTKVLFVFSQMKLSDVLSDDVENFRDLFAIRCPLLDYCKIKETSFRYQNIRYFITEIYNCPSYVIDDLVKCEEFLLGGLFLFFNEKKYPDEILNKDIEEIISNWGSPTLPEIQIELLTSMPDSYDYLWYNPSKFEQNFIKNINEFPYEGNVDSSPNDSGIDSVEEVINNCLNTSDSISISDNNGVGHNLIVVLEIGSDNICFKILENLDKKIYTLKIISDNVPEDKLTLQNEIKVIEKLDKDFVTKYHKFWDKANNHYIQMDFCTDNLKNIIQQKHKFFMREGSEPMSIMEYYLCCQLFKEILECVQHLHESEPSIIHRDIKPENILISEIPYNNRFVKLANFGIARSMEDNCNTLNLSEEKGTRNYMAPEVYSGMNGKSKYSCKSDVYSIGVMVQELFNFSIDSTNKVITGNVFLTPKWESLKQIIEEMSIRKYRKRPTCRELLSAYNKWGIDLAELKTSEEYQNYNMPKANNHQDKFFIKYLNAKILNG